MYKRKTKLSPIHISLIALAILVVIAVIVTFAVKKDEPKEPTTQSGIIYDDSAIEGGWETLSQEEIEQRLNDKVQAGNFEEAWRMWNRDNLNIVAFVNYYSTNVEGCAVENVEGAKFNDAINSIEDLPQTKESQTVRSEVYTIDGKRIEADQMGRGLYIIRDIQADGSVHTRKVMRK